MNLSKLSVTLLLILFAAYSPIYSQSDQEQIMQLRDDSNKALYSKDIDKVLSILIEEVLITTGNGNLISGKEELRKYITPGGLDKSYWVRTTTEIQVNQERGLAWETGTWKGYNRGDDNHPFAGGKYSAMWTKESGAWQIKSQLFVTLE